MNAITTPRRVWTRAEIRERISTIPRLLLAHLPTPLEHCARLSDKLGGPQIYVKRDDLTGLAFGGNKMRQLEFLFADILERGADVVVAGAYTQSNWCRQITASAAKLGLGVSLVLLHGEKGPARQGNLLLDELMGADVTVVDLNDIQQLAPMLHAKAHELTAKGHRPYVIDPFSLEMLARSTLGYVAAACELDEQLEALDISPSYIYLAGANMTPAGLALGMYALGRATQVVAITPIRWEEDRATDIARIATAASELMGLDIELTPDDIRAHDDYIGERYGVVTPASREAFGLAARTEGLILDPVYSSKAMAGLIDHIRRGLIAAGEPVVFVHTGGHPAVFAYADDLVEGD